MNFTEYVKKFDKDFLNNNFEQIVRDFNKNNREKNPNTRKVKPPTLLPNKLKPNETLTYSVLFGSATFEDYKADFEQRIQIPDTDKNIVIEDYLNTYINQPLKDKNTNVRSIYKDIKTGKIPNYFVSITDKYLYYSNRHSVFELIKFEDFLNNQAQQPEKGADTNSQYSITDWATIFYYADETKLLTDDKTTKARIEKFMDKHNVNTTFNTFKNNYHTAKKRINETNNFPISKLNHIIPFVKENYKQAVTKIENDIIFLENESDDY